MQCHCILPTQDVNGFLFASLNRFILALEAIMSWSGLGTESLTVASAKQQEMNGIMVSTLQLSLSGSNPGLRQAIWLTDWSSMRRCSLPGRQPSEEPCPQMIWLGH